MGRYYRGGCLRRGGEEGSLSQHDGIEIYEGDDALMRLAGGIATPGAERFTERDFCLGLERLYYASTWNWWKRLKFEVGWLMGKYRD